jgi:hypothetical protein
MKGNITKRRTMNNPGNSSSLRAKFVYYAVVVFIGLLALNLCASVLWNRERKRGTRHVVSAVPRAGAPPMTLICQENIAGPHYDFLLNDARGGFERITVSPRNPVDFSRPVPCVAYSRATQDIEPRLKTLPLKKRGEKRIVFIGDSFTYGEGVQSGNAFPDVMDRYFKNFGDKSPYRAINFGRIGFDMPDLYNVSFKAALRAKPDVIYYVWIANDTPPGGLPYPDILGLSAFYSSRAYQDSLNGFALNKLLQTIIIRRRIHSATLDWYARVHGSENKSGLKEFQKYIRLMKKEARASGAEFRIALFPMLIGDKNRYPLKETHAVVSRITRSEGVTTLDLTNAVLARPAPELWVHPANQHPNVYAHRAAARSLAHTFGITENTQPLPVCIPDSKKRIQLHDALPCEIYEFPNDAAVFTNDANVRQILKQQTGRSVELASNMNKARDLCPKRRACVFILSLYTTTKSLPKNNPSCLPFLHFKDKTIALCPLSQDL